MYAVGSFRLFFLFPFPVEYAMVRQTCLLFLFLMGMTLLPGCQRSGDDRQAVSDESQPTVGYVTNGIASFWVMADKGARDAARDHNAQVEVRMPPSGVSDQKRMVQDLIDRGTIITRDTVSNDPDTVYPLLVIERTSRIILLLFLLIAPRYQYSHAWDSSLCCYTKEHLHPVIVFLRFHSKYRQRLIQMKGTFYLSLREE